MRPGRALALGLLPLLAACDPMGATDGVAPWAGRAQVNNAGVHIINPNGSGGGANPGGSGQRGAVVMERYNSGEDPRGDLWQRGNTVGLDGN